jgi:hypothetical protein
MLNVPKILNEKQLNQKLLTVGNPKTEKSVQLGYYTAILHLAPAGLSGFMMCLWATAGCIAGCLNSAGRGGIGITKDFLTTNTVQKARIIRTVLYKRYTELFFKKLERELVFFVRKCKRLNLLPCLRVNGTSDDFALVEAVHEMKQNNTELKDLTLYDYSKNYDGSLSMLDKVDITLSWHEKTDKDQALSLIDKGLNFAVVFSTAKGSSLPDSFHGIPVIDGDIHDLRFLDPKGVIVGLRAKGKARKDISGFVQKVAA